MTRASCDALPVWLAASVTPMMFDETSCVPCAASWTLRAISRVAACCSSTAPAMAVAVSLMPEMVPLLPSIAATACRVASWI